MIYNLLTLGIRKFNSCGSKAITGSNGDEKFKASHTRVKNLDAFSQYCNEIKGFELLDAEKEKELLIKVSNYNKEQARVNGIIKDGYLVNDDIKDNLEKLKMDYNFALNELFEGNAKLVLSVASKYGSRDKMIEKIDLIQAGNDGLVKAINKFDVNSGNRLCTYAVPLIEQAIRNEVNYNGLVRLPEHIVKAQKKFKNYINNYFNNYGCYPSDEEVAYRFDCNEEKVREIMNYATTAKDLDSMIDEDNSITLGDTISDTSMYCPEEYVVMCETKREIDDSIKSLSFVEQEIVLDRNGFNGDIKTRDEIGKIIGVNGNKVNALEAKVKEKLKSYLNEHDITSCSY